MVPVQNGQMDHPFLVNWQEDTFLRSLLQMLESFIVFALLIIRLLDPSCTILQTIGSQIPYECAIGLNGYVFLVLEKWIVGLGE